MNALTKEDWVEIYYALESKKHAIEEGRYHSSDEQDDAERWSMHLGEIMGTIGPDGENMDEPPTIIIEQAEGLIVAVWSTDPAINCETFYNEDDPPEDEEGKEAYEETLLACRHFMHEHHMTDLLDPNNP